MENNIFNPMEIDAIGEIMNISLGSSATAVSNMLDHRVDITTPEVSVITVEEFTLGELDPAIGVEIRYISGLEGSNIMLLKRSDVKMIVDILMGTETTDEEFELNELTISAVCEVMNQMMGAASTALSDFLGKLVNISTPQSFELDDFEQFKREHFPVTSGSAVVVRFILSIDGALKSEFINVMSVELARELIAGFGLEEETPAPQPAPEAESGGKMSQEEIERLMGSMAEPEPQPKPTGESESGGKMSQEEIERLMGSMTGAAPKSEPVGGSESGEVMSQKDIKQPIDVTTEPAAAQQPPVHGQPVYPPPTYGGPYGGQPAPGGYPPPGEYGVPPQGYRYPPYAPGMAPQSAEPKVIQTQAPHMPQFDASERLGEEQAQNLDLIMSVPLEVSVEIGRTRRKVQDILAFSKGSLVVLDKLAGDQVDLFVNGQCIAKGDVVVIDDNFGIRITEILEKPEMNEIAQL